MASFAADAADTLIKETSPSNPVVPFLDTKVDLINTSLELYSSVGTYSYVKIKPMAEWGDGYINDQWLPWRFWLQVMNGGASNEAFSPQWIQLLPETIQGSLLLGWAELRSRKFEGFLELIVDIPYAFQVLEERQISAPAKSQGAKVDADLRIVAQKIMFGDNRTIHIPYAIIDWSSSFFPVFLLKRGESEGEAEPLFTSFFEFVVRGKEAVLTGVKRHVRENIFIRVEALPIIEKVLYPRRWSERVVEYWDRIPPEFKKPPQTQEEFFAFVAWVEKNVPIVDSHYLDVKDRFDSHQSIWEVGKGHSAYTVLKSLLVPDSCSKKMLK